MKLAILALSAALALGGCASPLGPATSAPAPVGTLPAASPTAPAFPDSDAGRSMVAARSAYSAALAAALAYGKLPTCSETQMAPCRDAALIVQMQKADRVAFAALDAADTILQQPSLGPNARDRAIAAAQAALVAFTTLTGAIK